MDTTELKPKEGEEESRGEEVGRMGGVASGGSFTPVGSVGSGSRPRKRGRRYSYSEGSPVEGIISSEYYRARGTCISEMVEEMRTYVLNDFNKNNREKRIEFFEKRLGNITRCQLEMDSEYVRMVGMAEKVASLERSYRRFADRDPTDVVEAIKADMEEVAVRIVGEVKGECLGMMERLRSKTEELMSNLEHVEESRRTEADRAERVYRERLDVLGRKVVAMESKLEASVRFMDEIRGNMNSVYDGLKLVDERVAGVMGAMGETMEPLSVQIGRIGGLNVESLAGGIEEVKRSITQVNEVVGKLGVQGGREVMDVDEAVEGEGLWSQVVKKGRRKKGPQVVLEVEKDKVVNREDLKACLDPKEGDVRVRGLRKQGRNFVVEVHDRVDIDKSKGIEKLGEIGVKVDGSPRMRSPRILISDVESELGKEDLGKAVLARNREIFQGVPRIEGENLGECFVPERPVGVREEG